MTVVLAYAENPAGEAAAREALQQCRFRREALTVLSASREITLERDQVVRHLAELGTGQDAVAVELGHSDLQDPSDAILQVAQREDASLVVVGLHRRSRVGKMLLGSTAQRILLEATCPVLAVREAG